jgi:predicted transcriptional regulator
MLRRMTEKNMIACREQDGLLVYSPLLDREHAVQQETKSFLGRVYNGSVSLLLSAITQKEALTDQELSELQAILEEAKKHD